MIEGGKIDGLVGAYGWVPIESKDPHMFSWQKEKETVWGIQRSRLNFYFTTGTITISGQGKVETSRDIDTYEKLEEIVSKP